MCNNRGSIVILCALAAPGALAQQMYKFVGPDGKVTFSDRPALQKPGKISIMEAYTLRPYAARPTSAELAAADAARKPAAEAPLATGSSSAAPVLTPEVYEAIVSVMVQVEFSRRFYNFCNAGEASARAFNAAVLGWKRRNAVAIEQQKRLLMQVVSPNKREELQDKAAKLLAEEHAKVVPLNSVEREAWCGAAVTELRNGNADIVQPAMMAVPIVPYRAR